MDVKHAAKDRTDLWVGLLRTLTEEFPRWANWKNVASAFAGSGDVDSFAPREDWRGIERTFASWAAEQDFGPMITCRHVPQGPHLITLQEDSPFLVHLDVKTRGTFRGSTLIDVWELQSLVEVNDQGYRQIRPGAEGVIKLCMNATRKGGRPNLEALEAKNVTGMLASDSEGVAMACELFGPASRAMARGAAAVVEGGWDRSAMRKVEAWSLLRGMAEPHVAGSRLWVNHWAADRCPVIRLVKENDRRLPADRDRWLDEVKKDHDVLVLLGS